MPEPSHTPPPPRRRLRKLVVLAALLTAALWLVHPILLSWAVSEALAMWARQNKFTVSVARIDVKLSGPCVLEEIEVESLPGARSSTVANIQRLEWQWGNLLDAFSERGRPLHSLTIRGLQYVVNRSWQDPEPAAPSNSPGFALPLPKWLPEKIEVTAPVIQITGRDDQWLLQDLELRLTENETGILRVGSASAYTAGLYRSLDRVSAATAWKSGSLWLGDMALAPGITIESVSVDLLQPSGPTVVLSAGCFGGSLRADLSLSPEAGTMDLAAWASGIDLREMASSLALQAEVSGRLLEGRFTFRGKPDRPADAEASLRLVADNTRWNNRGWESLEIGASLIHRRLVVTNFDLRQKDNHVNFNGEVSLAEGWSQIAQSPFLVNLRGDIYDVGSLASLVGSPLVGLKGRMSAAGSVSGRSGQLDGFLSIEASAIEYPTLPPSSLRIESLFHGNEIEVALCDVFSGKDAASLRGRIGLSSPHQYAADLTAKIADLSTYLRPFKALDLAGASAGALDINWQGDGTLQAHSGAFDVKLRDFVSMATPSGLTGEFSGTYSPQNLYFSKLDMSNGPLRLNSRATLAESGVTLKDLELTSGQKTLLEGGAFLPINLFSVFSGGSWQAAIDPDREAYLRFTTPKDLNIRSLLELAGQNPVADGTLHVELELGGKPALMSGNGSISLRNIAWSDPGSKAPSSSLEARIAAGNGTAALDGSLTTAGFPAMKLSAAMPFGLVQTTPGNWTWSNPTGNFTTTLDFPKTDLGVFRSLLPKVRTLSGEVSGQVTISGTVAEPRTNGRISLRNGNLEISARSASITNTQALLTFDGTRMMVDHFRGEVGAGPFQISGGVGLANLANPQWNLRLTGDKILLARNAGIRLRANVDLAATGDNTSGSVRGSLRFTDGRIFQRFEVTPLLFLPTEETPLELGPPFPPGTIPKPFASWNLNLKIENESPFLIQGNIASGEIEPNLTLRGTVGQPVPVGRISLKDVQAFLPFTTMNIHEGRIDFLPDSPWIPLLDVRGTAQTPDFEVQAYAFGPLNEKKLILRSEPPLPQESLVLLLTTGIAPGGNTMGAGFGEAAAGQGGLFLLRSFARQLDIPGFDADALVNRLQLQTIPPRSLGERTTVRGKLRLTDSFDLVTERDGYGFFNAGVSYTWRFR